MSKIKVHEYAKQIGKPAKELVVLLQEQGVNVKSHLSNIDEDGIKIINKKLGISTSEIKNVADKKPARVGFRFGQRPSNARSVGTAASIKKEVEKEEKAKERAAKAEKKAEKDAVVSKEAQEVKSMHDMSKKGNNITNETASKLVNTDKKAEGIVNDAKQQKNKKNESEKQSTQEEKKVGKIEGSVKSQGQNNSQQSSPRKNQQGSNQQQVKKQENTSKGNDILKSNESSNVKQSNENVQNVNKNSIENKNNADKNINQGNSNNQGNNGDRNNQGNRNNGDRNNQGNRNNGDRNNQGNRNNGDRNNQGNRNNGDRNNQGNRNNGDRNNQGNRNNGDRNNQGNRNNGDRNNQGNRNNGDRNNQGNRYNNDRNGQGQGNRNNGDRNNQGNRYNNDRNGQGQGQGNRNNGDRNNQGNRYNNDRNGQGQGQGNRNNGDRNNQGNRYNNDRNGQGQGNRNNGDRNNQGNRYNNDRNGQGQGNRNNGDRNNQGNRYNNDRNGQGQGNRNNGQGQGNRYNNDRNGQGQGNRNNGDRNNDRNGQGQNRGRYGNNDKNQSLTSSSSFTATASKSSLEVGRSSRANWTNRKNNNEDYKYEDSKENFEGLNKSSKKNKKKNEKPKSGAFIKPEPVVVQEPEDGIRTIILPEILTIKELADKIKIQPAMLVKKLFLAGKVVTINQEITFEEAEEIALEYNCIAEAEVKIDIVAEILKEEEEAPETLVKRAPVVCVMGHVDHGKTSLLDAIRESNVTAKEAGGITQHIGAYVVNINDEMITFLDTPGHEAFTSMRMRGANSTDIAILVVAADDGVMPQTIEAISHAKAAGIQIIVAINKIDKPSANIERVKQELVEYGLIAEDWGGDTVFVPVSAHTHEGIEQLLEMILLTAEMVELKANPDRLARGLVIEAELDKGRGPVATVLVQKGTLNVGDTVAVGSVHGKVRAMIDDKGRRVKEAGPSTPVEILGLNGVPNAGEILIATENEKEARNIAETFIKQGREKLLEDTKSKLSLDGLFSQIKAGNIKELNIIVKADVQGSVEAVKQSLLKLSNEEVAVRIIHGGVGAINESDVILASASNAIIIGFNVRPDNTAREISEREKVDLRLYKVIYNAIEDVAAAMKGMLDPIFEEKVIGHAEIRQIYKASGVGNIAGSYVLDGKIVRGSKVRISREGEVIFDGNLASLKRFKDDVKEVATGYDCGLLFEKFNDIQEFDQVEVYIMQEVPR